ncbi:MAG: MBL fold metallo-hydrolase, partial [Proteobacteria bacterium]|nr:MBL fold metallo-hydrolase [Pseudomonadota bacterium]
MDVHPPFLNAGNAGPFTLGGTRTYRFGRRSAVVLDPGPDVEEHVRALVVWLDDADDVRVVVTHGHRDHAGAAPRLARALGVPVMGPVGLSGVEVPLADGDALIT